MAKGKATATPSKVQRQKEEAARLSGGGSEVGDVELSDDVVAEIEELKKQRREAFEAELAKETESLTRIATLKAERGNAQRAWNAAEEKLREIDRELAKLTGKAAPAGGGGKGGKRTRRTGEALEAERRELAAAGSKLYTVLKKEGHGKEVRALDLKGQALGANVGAALKPYVAAHLVKIHPNGKFTAYSFAKDGELPAAK